MSDRAITVHFSAEAARVMVGGSPAVDSGRALACYYVSRPSGGGCIVGDLAAARRRERYYDRCARRRHGPGAGYSARIVPVYADGSASGPWALEAERHVRDMSARSRRHWGVAVVVAP